MAVTIDALGLAEDLEKADSARPGARHGARDPRPREPRRWPRKADLHEIELRLEARFSRKLEQKIADVQIGLIKWFIRHGMIAASRRSSSR